jgi:hypothetical protein
MSKNFDCCSCGETNNDIDLPYILQVPETRWGGAKEVTLSNSAWTVINFTLCQLQETEKRAYGIYLAQQTRKMLQVGIFFSSYSTEATGLKLVL